MALLEDLKNRLRITWTEEDTDLQKILDTGKAQLNDITGANHDYEVDLIAQELLLERSRYVYNNAVDEFTTNFADDLLRFQLRVATKLRSEADAAANA